MYMMEIMIMKRLITLLFSSNIAINGDSFVPFTFGALFGGLFDWGMNNRIVLDYLVAYLMESK